MVFSMPRVLTEPGQLHGPGRQSSELPGVGCRSIGRAGGAACHQRNLGPLGL